MMVHHDARAFVPIDDFIQNVLGWKISWNGWW